MRRFLSSFAVLVAAAVVVPLAGCEDKNRSTPAPDPIMGRTPGTSPMSTLDAAAMVETSGGHDGGKGDSHMANCPSAVTGTKVALKDVEGGIEISITGKDESAAKEIKARMTKLVASDKNEGDAGIKHTGKGEGHGVYGRCTIVMRNTKLETTEIPNGVKATVKANDKSEIDWLRRETRERDRESKSPAAEGAGTHRMAHCPSAVEGAKTAVKESKEGVIVTVTGAADAVKEIRARAKHASDMSKLPEPPKVEHNSEGKGGGGLGRCPIVVEGDTTVEAKDVEGGSEITVKAKKDVFALQKETRARAANFGVK